MGGQGLDPGLGRPAGAEDQRQAAEQLRISLLVLPPGELRAEGPAGGPACELLGPTPASAPGAPLLGLVLRSSGPPAAAAVPDGDGLGDGLGDRPKRLNSDSIKFSF